MIPGRDNYKRCIFVREWDCNLETDEIPVEVCQLCVEARKTYIMETRRLMRNSRNVEQPPLSPIDKLQKLDRIYTSGQIDAEEYLQRRREIVRMLRNEPAYIKRDFKRH
jgi:hypothetical protein